MKSVIENKGETEATGSHTETEHENVLLEELTVLVIGIGASGSVEETVNE